MGTMITSIHELMTIFKESLICLKEPLKKAQISWDKAKSYDDWDDICQSLFRNFVANSIYHSHADGVSLEEFNFELFSHRKNYDDYLFMCAEVNDAIQESESTFLVFIDVHSEEDIFDFARCIEIDSKGEILDNEVYIPHSEVKFSLKKITPQGIKTFDKINVLL